VTLTKQKGSIGGGINITIIMTIISMIVRIITIIIIIMGIITIITIIVMSIIIIVRHFSDNTGNVHLFENDEQTPTTQISS